MFSQKNLVAGYMHWMEEAGLVPKKKKDGTWDGVYWSGTSHATL